MSLKDVIKVEKHGGRKEKERERETERDRERNYRSI